jgi:hypothetical protein
MKISLDKNVCFLISLFLIVREKKIFLFFLILGHNQIRASANSEIPLASRFVRRIQSNNDSTIAKENTFSFNFDIPLCDMEKN